jgi:hypothetical protein
MYISGKMRPVDTIPGVEGGGIEENDGGGEFQYDTFVYVTMYPQHNNKKKIYIYIYTPQICDRLKIKYITKKGLFLFQQTLSGQVHTGEREEKFNLWLMVTLTLEVW